MKNQILSLVIDMNTNEPETFLSFDNRFRFTQIFSIFPNLQYLHFCPSSIWRQRLSFFTPPLTVISTNLLQLHVSLRDFTICLYLLDGCFNQLRTFYVDIFAISASNETVNNTVDYFFKLISKLNELIILFSRKNYLL